MHMDDSEIEDENMTMKVAQEMNNLLDMIQLFVASI